MQRAWEHNIHRPRKKFEKTTLMPFWHSTENIYICPGARSGRAPTLRRTGLTISPWWGTTEQGRRGLVEDEKAQMRLAVEFCWSEGVAVMCRARGECSACFPQAPHMWFDPDMDSSACAPHNQEFPSTGQSVRGYNVLIVLYSNILCLQCMQKEEFGPLLHAGLDNSRWCTDSSLSKYDPSSSNTEKVRQAITGKINIYHALLTFEPCDV